MEAPLDVILRERAARSSVARRLGRSLVTAALFACVVVAGAGCSEDANPLAPYDGARPLDLLKVTQSFTPEIQWVGGRVAAVGVNRGTRAALDSTLVWMQAAPDNSIGSFVTFGQSGDDALVMSYGGTPQDSLTDGETYTFWLAERAALDAGLDSTRIDHAAFADTTITMQLIVQGFGRTSSDLNLGFEITRDERLTGESYVVRWTPGDVRFRRLAIRQAPSGGFTELIWHVLVPDGQPGSIAPPVVIGVAPEGTEEAIAFPDTGFNPDTTASAYTLWAVTDDWNGSFNPITAQGYAQFLMFPCNFDTDDPCNG